MCLGNISKDFTIDNMKKSGLNGYVYDFSVDYNTIDVSDIIHIYKYLMGATQYKTIVALIIQSFISLLNFSGSIASMFKVSD